MAVAQKERLSGKEMRCPNCGQKTSGIDSCEWCHHPLLKGSEARRRKAEKLAAKEEARRKAQEARQAELTEKRAKKEAKPASQQQGPEQLQKIVATGKQAGKDIEQEPAIVGRNSEAIEDALELGLAPEIDRERFLEVYPVNEPYAYIGIEASQPRTYEVCEVSLTSGEEELLKGK